MAPNVPIMVEIAFANSATATVLKLQTSDDRSEIDFGNVPK